MKSAFKFGELDNRCSERVERLHGVFAKAAVSVEVPSNIVKALWDKFLMVTSFGGVGAIARAPIIGVTRSFPETRRLLEQCLEEVVAVARARKIEMSTTAIADTMKFYDGLPPADAAAPPRGWQRKQISQGRLCLDGGRGRRAQAHPPKRRLRAATRGRGAGYPTEARHSDGGRVDAVPPAFRNAEACLQESGARQDARVAVEAAIELGWERYIGLEGRFVGMHSFGASGKITDVYKKFDINAEAAVRAAHETMSEVAAL
jgi:hypothetical protein